MRLLLDTHIAVWAALDPAALMQTERNIMSDTKDPLVLSAVAVWELRLKWNSLYVSGDRKGPLHPTAIVTFAAAMSWQLLALTAAHTTAELTDPLSHKDPFDELLLIQAQQEGMRLLTRDSKLVAHPLAISG